MVWSLLFTACAPGPGHVSSPLGQDALRTAWFVERETDGVRELDLLLSNGLLPCALPTVTSELESAVTGACREGARHLTLRLFHPTGPFDGVFAGRTNARPDEAADEPFVRASWYAVIEAALVDLDGLGRSYLATESEFLPAFGSGGDVTVAPTDDGLAGTFLFPAEDLSGAFEARACQGDATLVELLVDYPVALCL